MGKPKANISIFFKHEGKEYFIVQVLNVGRDTDELKFVFNDPTYGHYVIPIERPDSYGPDTQIRRRSEFTYHSDGSVLSKLVADENNPFTVHKNPMGEGTRRTPLAQVVSWEAVLSVLVPDYRSRRKRSASSRRFLPDNTLVFNGGPLQVIIYVVGKSAPRLEGGEQTSILILEDIADSVDIAIRATPSDYTGREMELPGYGRLWVDSAVATVVESEPIPGIEMSEIVASMRVLELSGHLLDEGPSNGDDVLEIVALLPDSSFDWATKLITSPTALFVEDGKPLDFHLPHEVVSAAQQIRSGAASPREASIAAEFVSLIQSITSGGRTISVEDPEDLSIAIDLGPKVSLRGQLLDAVAAAFAAEEEGPSGQ